MSDVQTVTHRYEMTREAAGHFFGAIIHEPAAGMVTVEEVWVPARDGDACQAVMYPSGISMRMVERRIVGAEE